MKSGLDGARPGFKLARRGRALAPEAKPRDRKKGALRRLGVTEAQLRAAPDISSLLKQARGGLKATLEALRFSFALDAVAFVEKYDAVSARDRESLPWEAIALAAEVDPAGLLGAAILAIQAHSSNAVKIIALSHHPEITRRRIEFAALAGGERDRHAIDTALGFLPTTKGSTFIINPLGTRSEEKEDDGPEETVDDEREGDLEHLFPSLSKTQEALVPLRARLIEAGS